MSIICGYSSSFGIYNDFSLTLKRCKDIRVFFCMFLYSSTTRGLSEINDCLWILWDMTCAGKMTFRVTSVKKNSAFKTRLAVRGFGAHLRPLDAHTDMMIGHK